MDKIFLCNVLNFFQLALRNSGYSETGVGEICAALGLLAKHGILGLGITPLPSASLPNALPYFPLTTEQSATASVFGPIGPVSLGNLNGNKCSPMVCIMMLMVLIYICVFR